MSSPSRMAQVLTALDAFTVPENFGIPEVDWDLFTVKNEERVSDYTLCPCECLVADEKFGFEIQHKDGIYGDKDGPAGYAYGSALGQQAHGYNNMQAVIAPNLSPAVRTMLITKVGTTNTRRIIQMWGGGQEAFGTAVNDAHEHGILPENAAEDHVIVAAVFIHPCAGKKQVNPEDATAGFENLSDEEFAKSMHAIWCLVYMSTLGLLVDAATGGLTVDERRTRRKEAVHPYRGFKFAGQKSEESAT